MYRFLRSGAARQVQRVGRRSFSNGGSRAQQNSNRYLLFAAGVVPVSLGYFLLNKNNIENESATTQDAAVLEQAQEVVEEVQEHAAEVVDEAIEAAEEAVPKSESSSEEPEAEAGADAEAESNQSAAFNPETGEINWDCPCLGGMAHGPCGEEFKEAFACFVYSESEPKGIDCIKKFENMRTCFKQYPEHYKEELYEDDE
ncbi:uncharacterized protein CANTADRAFT_32900, partial [Suhomyces tanzawaensis NRRL Y-17324]